VLEHAKELTERLRSQLESKKLAVNKSSERNRVVAAERSVAG